MSLTGVSERVTHIEVTDRDRIIERLKELGCQKAHFTNGTYNYPAKMVVPTTLAGFYYIVRNTKPLPLIIAINSDESMEKIGIKDFEKQSIRANKVATPLATLFSDLQIIIIYYDETTPNALYEALHRENITETLHKWGYGTTLNSPKIEGAELFQAVYGFPLPNDIKPVCHDVTPIAEKSQNVNVVDLRNTLIIKEGILFEVPEELEEYVAPPEELEKYVLPSAKWLFEKQEALIFTDLKPSSLPPTLTPELNPESNSVNTNEGKCSPLTLGDPPRGGY